MCIGDGLMIQKVLQHNPHITQIMGKLQLKEDQKPLLTWDVFAVRYTTILGPIHTTQKY